MSERAAHYFSQLGPEVVLQLYKLYQPDFELFGYQATQYLDIAGSNYRTT